MNARAHAPCCTICGRLPCVCRNDFNANVCPLKRWYVQSGGDPRWAGAGDTTPVAHPSSNIAGTSFELVVPANMCLWSISTYWLVGEGGGVVQMGNNPLIPVPDGIPWGLSRDEFPCPVSAIHIYIAGDCYAWYAIVGDM